MSTADFSSVSSALATLFQPRVRAQMNRSCVTMQLLPYQEGEGKNLQWDVEFGNPAPTTSVLADGADVSTYNDDSIQAAVLQWGTYSEAFAVTGKAMAAARRTANPAELEDLFGEKFERAVRRLTKSINIDIVTQVGGTDQIQGFFGGSNPPIATSGSYAGLSTGSYAQWKSNVDANGGNLRPLSFQLMRNMRKSIYTACGEQPNMIVCSPNIFEKYGLLFGDNRRYVQDVTLGGRKITLDAGFKALEFDGIPVFQDVDMTDVMLFLNTDYVRLRQLPDSPQVANRAPGMVELHGMAEEQLGTAATKLRARINPLAVTGDSFKVQLVLYPQLQVERPNACGVIKDLETT